MKTRKWKRYWAALGLLFTVQVCLILWLVDLENTKEEGHITGLTIVIETVGSVCGLLLALIIFLKSNESNARQQHEIMQHRESLHSRQIQTILDSNNYQTEVLKSLFESQNRTLRETITKHFTKSKEEDGFEASMRVYEISRIDLKIEELELDLKEAYIELDELQKWRLFRPVEEKQEQLRKQKEVIQKLIVELTELKRQRDNLENGK